MIRVRNDSANILPENALFITASEKITAEDYEQVLIPAIEKKLKNFEKIRLLYQLDETFDGFTAGAMWDDAKLGMQHYTAWEKIAVVTDVNWVHNAVTIFSFTIPAEIKVFANTDLSQAQDWLKH